MPLSYRAPRWSRDHGLAAGGISTDSVRTVPDRECAIQMLIDDDVQIRHRRSKAGGLDLQQQVLPSHGVVLVDHAFMLDGKNAIQILSFRWHKCRPRLSRRPGKLLIELLDI